MKQKILKNGHSLAVTIPVVFVRALGLKPGQTVTAKVDPASGVITYTFPTSQMSLLSRPASS